jgi:hypothetical protein
MTISNGTLAPGERSRCHFGNISSMDGQNPIELVKRFLEKNKKHYTSIERSTGLRDTVGSRDRVRCVRCLGSAQSQIGHVAHRAYTHDLQGGVPIHAPGLTKLYALRLSNVQQGQYLQQKTWYTEFGSLRDIIDCGTNGLER